MKRDIIIDEILNSSIINKWHWFRYHFDFYSRRGEHPFAKSIVDALLRISERIPEFPSDTIKRLASYSGREKDIKHYEQLLQVLAEIYVINRVVNFFGDRDYEIMYEPTVGNSKKNPEIMVIVDGVAYGIEVKQPSLIKHMNQRATKQIQISTRTSIGPIYATQHAEQVLLPKDNVIKDFLISANNKFESFKKNENFYSILFIVWDDAIYEPISALLGNPSGLLMDQSFARDQDGNIMRFPNVDVIMLDWQLIQFIRGSRDEPLFFGKKHIMYYGKDGEYPFKIVLQNPYGNILPDELMLECFQVYEPEAEMGAEYVPSDILWRL